MLGRLGNVIYWTATGIAIIVVALIAYGAVFGTGQADPALQVSVIIGAGMIWLVGLAVRYVLAGPKGSPPN